MPKVGKHILLLIAGLLWSSVGAMLIIKALEWLWAMDYIYQLIGIASSLVLGSIITYFGFSKIAAKNINRIQQYEKEKICVWAFQKWTSYLLIIFMMNLGIFLKNADFFPKVLLLIIYFSIGMALFLSSIAYYLKVLQIKNRNSA